MVSSFRHHRALWDLCHPCPSAPTWTTSEECRGNASNWESERSGFKSDCATSQLREFGQLSPPLSPRVFISEVGTTPPLSQAVM